MPKQAAKNNKKAAHHAHAVPRRQRKIARRKAATALAPAATATMVADPKPQIIEVMELDFVDPDLVPYREEALVGSFDDEDI